MTRGVTAFHTIMSTFQADIDAWRADPDNSPFWQEKSREVLAQVGHNLQTLHTYCEWYRVNGIADLSCREQFERAKQFNMSLDEPLECNHAMNESCPACRPAKLGADAEIPYE